MPGDEERRMPMPRRQPRPASEHILRAGRSCLLLRAQRGAALIVSLVFLLIMTIIAITAMTTTTLEERMAGNSKDMNLAFQAAEAALRDAEDFLRNMQPGSMPAFDNTAGLYARGAAPSPFAAATWSGTESRTSALAGVGSSPRWLVESTGELRLTKVREYGSLARRQCGFRIVARGTGGTDVAQVTLESRYGRELPFCP